MELLQLYDKNKNKKAGLTEYKDLCIESVLTTGDKKLSFSYSKEAKYYDEIVEEGYIRTKKDEFVIKARDVGVDYTRFDCVLNLETLEANIFDRFESVEQTITNALNLAIVGTGWTVKSNLKKKRTVRCVNKSSLEIVQELKRTYRVDIVFNTLEKQIEIHEHLGQDKGAYFIDSLNLTALQVQSDSYKFATRIIAEGKDGLTFSSINNGKNYVENYQYSKKVKTLYWKDERYTIKESLLEDARAKLEEISKPFISYNASILNLAELNPKYKSILDYSLGDTITLISRNNKVKDKQRIVKTIEWPQDHTKDTVELANAVLKFEDVQQENQETTDTVSNITVDNGTVDGSTIDSITTKQIEDFEANVIKVAKLKAILAEIENLHVNKADIQNLNAVIAKIGTLEATKASIAELNAIHAIIQQLKVGKADIADLNAAVAKVGILENKTAVLENALAGNLTADNFKTNAITAGSAVIAEGAIGSSQISSLSVNKLEAGDITTSKHRIVSVDGTIEIVGNQILINRNNVNRVILGEYRKQDNTTEYGLLIRGKDGKTIMLDSDGVHNAGITNGAIDNNKVADNANISGNKLDINSVIREVNSHGTETIAGTRIQVGDRTLDVELSTQKNTITEHGKELSSQKATIQALDNAIKLKVDSQTFTQSTTTINNNINKAKEEAINSANSNTTNAINNIQIGGVNLLISNLAKTYPNNVGLGTENKRNDESISYVRILSDSKKHISVFGATIGEILKDKFILNQKYTISCEVRIPTEGYVGFYAGTPVNHVLANKWTKISYTFIGTSNNVRVVGFEYSGTQLDYRNLKLEEGEFATDYSLAPEDVKKYSDDVAKAKSDLAKTEAIANADGKITEEERKRIQQAQENLNIAIAKAEKAKQDAINTASTDATNKANNALNSAKAYTNTEITTVNTHLNKATAEINVLKEKIELKVGQSDIDKSIEDVKFGDRNLFPESYLGSHGCAMGKWNNPYMNIPTYNIVVNRPNQGNNFGFNIKKPIKINGGKGVTFTFLFNYIINKYTNSNSSNMHGYTRVYYKDGSKQDFDFNSKIVNCNDKSNWGKWISLKFTFTTDINKEIDNIGLFYFYTDGASEGTNFDFTIPKLVIGNKIGDWTPAPEDTDQLIIDNIKTVTDKISTVESNLTQKTNSIEAGVRDLNSTTQSITTNVSNINRDLTSKINSNLNAAKSFATDIATNKANTAKQEAINSAKAFVNAEINTVNSKVHNVESNLNILSDRINSKVSQSDIDKVVTTIRTERIIYARGTGNDYPANSIVKVNGKTITDGQGRGLRINALNKATLERVFLQDYDTFGSEDAKVSFVNKINELNNGDFIIVITSQDASYPLHQPIKGALEKIGATLFDRGGGTYREAYALIGRSKLGRGNGVEMFIPRTANDKRFAEVSVKVGEDGTFIGVNPNNIGLETTLIKSNISDISSNITQLRDSVTTQINSINSKTHSIETTLNGKASKQEVTEVNNRVATIKASLDSITQRISSTESKTHTLETSLNTLELNTRNLLLNSNFANKTKFTVWDKNNIEVTLKETLESFESEYFGNLLFTASSNGDSYASIFNVKVKANTEYTLAFDYLGAGSFIDGENSSSSYIWFYKDNKVLSNIKLDFKTIGDKKRRRYIKTFMVPNGVTALTIRVGFICNAYSWIAYDGFKLVEGSKNGDWTPAPEDFNSDIKLVSEKINSVESSITQNLNSITQRVSENKTLINSVNGNVTNVVNRVNVVESKITTNAIINSISSGINNNGLSINTVSTILDRTGLTVNNGALRVKNKAGKTVLEGDTGGNLVIKEGAFKVLNPAGDAICAIEQDNFLKVYGLRVFGTNNPVQFIGPGQKGIELKSENGPNTYIDFGFANQDFKNRIICYSDKNELILQGRGVEITPDTSFASEAKLEIRANAGGYSYIDFSNNYAEDYSTRLISFNGDTRLHVFGGLVVDSGTKSAMQRTEHYGDRLMYAVEACQNYFEDIYTCSLENGICTVEMDKVFLECVNCNEYEYYLIIDELEECNGLFAPIDLRLPNKFTVKEKNNGKSNAKFNVIVRARRKNFEKERLEEMKRHEIDEKILQQ